MTRRTASLLAWSLFGIGLVIFGVATWLSVVAGAESQVAPFLPVLLAFSGVGALVASRRPENPLGWLMLSFAATSIGLLADAYASYGLAQSPHAGGTPWAAWVFIVSIEVGFIPLLLILLLFPHGRLLSRRWRPVAWAAVLFPLVGGMASAISDVNFSVSGNFPTLRDPVRLLARSVVAPVYGAYQVVTLVVFALAAASLVVRFRRSRGEERQQVKWIAFAGALAAVGFAVVAALPLGIEPVAAWIVFVPLIAAAAGIAILKYRLYDIDVVINRTIVYGALAAFITCVYVAIVVGIGAAVGSRGKPNVALSIAATAVVAVAFQPVRERVQRFANRLVYGKRATPYEALSQFSRRMAGTIANEDLLPRMARILAEGTGAAHADVWLRVGDELAHEASWPIGTADAGVPRVPLGDGPVAELPGATRAVEVRHHGDLLGALAILTAPGVTLTATEEKLLADLASQAGLVLRNAGLTQELLGRLDELAASRQRVVAAQDEERRRLERNIHDGVEHQLEALDRQLLEARTLLDRDADRTRALLVDVRGEAQTALEALREVARGIYPPLLADRGLAAAVEGQARRAPVQVEVDAEGIGRYPQEVEAAVYFSVLETLRNVVAHSSATRARLRLWEEEGRLAFSLQDDGQGFDPAATRRRGGLQNVADRLAALDGTLEVVSAPGKGTTVSGRLPVPALEPVA